MLALRTGHYKVPDMTTDQIFEELHQVGFPNVFCCERDGTWSAYVNMRIKVEGAVFKVESGHNHKELRDALITLLERTRNAIKQLEESRK